MDALTPRCGALGCEKSPSHNGVFCVGHWRRLPTQLREPGMLRQAIKFLGVDDGFLAPPASIRTSPLREDGEGRDWV
jgi:hypothetical protein